MLRKYFSMLLVYTALAVLIIALLGLATLFFSLGLGLFGVGMAGVPVVFFIAANVAKRYRYRRDLVALCHIEQAVHLNLPLTRMLPAAAESATGVYTARQLQKLNGTLEAGESLSEAIRRHLQALPARVWALIQAAEQSGNIARQLSRVVEQEQKEARRDQGEEPLAVVYPMVVLLGLLVLLGGISVYILPKYEKIFEDFETSLPAITTLVFKNAAAFGLPVLGIAVVMALITFGHGFATLFDPGFGRREAFGSLRRIGWYMPIIHSAQRDRGLADVFDVIADATLMDHPLPEAIDRAAMEHLNPVLRGRIRQWAKGVRAGEDVGLAAAKARLPKVAVAMIRTGATAGNFSQVCRFLSRYHATRVSRLAELIRSAIVPLLVIGLSILVGLFVVAVFLPLVNLITHTAASVL